MSPMISTVISSSPSAPKWDATRALSRGRTGPDDLLGEQELDRVGPRLVRLHVYIARLDGQALQAEGRAAGERPKDVGSP